MYACTTKDWVREGPRTVTYFRGAPRCVTNCDRGGVSKLVQNSVMYFMDIDFSSIVYDFLMFYSLIGTNSLEGNSAKSSNPMLAKAQRTSPL